MKSLIVIKLTHTNRKPVFPFSLHKPRIRGRIYPFLPESYRAIEREEKEKSEKKKANSRAGGRARLMIPFGDVAASGLWKRPRYAIFSLSRAHTSTTKPWRDGRANNNEDNQSAVGRKGILWRGQDGRGGKYVGRTNTPLPSSLRRRYTGSSLSVQRVNLFYAHAFSSTMIEKPPHGGFKRTRTWRRVRSGLF